MRVGTFTGRAVLNAFGYVLLGLSLIGAVQGRIGLLSGVALVFFVRRLVKGLKGCAS